MQATDDELERAADAGVGAVLAALCRALEGHGLRVAADTARLRPDVYVVSDDPERPRALFEIKESEAELSHVLNQGHWPATLPLRVLLLPTTLRGDQVVEVLLAAGIRVVFYARTSQGVDFDGLDGVLGLLS